MNCDGKMSYKGFVFPVNPKNIRIRHDRKVSRGAVPYGSDAVSDMGAAARVISGEGEFFGENAVNDFMALKAAADSGGAGMLYIPSQKPICAVLSRLDMLCEDSEGIVKYSFTFVESESGSRGAAGVITGDGRSCLWDISYKYGADIDILIGLNPHIRRPDIPIMAWEKVRLC